jgi:hypothetical protein
MIAVPLATLAQQVDILQRQRDILLRTCKLLLNRLEHEGKGAAAETGRAIDLARDAISAIESLDVEPLEALPAALPLNASKPNQTPNRPIA